MRKLITDRPLAVASIALFTGLMTTSSSALGAAYYVGEIGARSVARGGANIVSPRDPSAAWLNPAALSLAPGLQLDLDANFVFLNSTFIRDCGGIANGCAPPAPVNREYPGNDGTSTHVYDIPGDRPAPNDDGEPKRADVSSLGNPGTPSSFDGATATSNIAGVQPIPRIMLSLNSDVFGFDGIGIGAYLYAPNNGDYAFGEDTPTRYTLVDRDLLEVYYGLALAYRYKDWLAVGAGMQFVTAGLNQSVRLSADQYSNEDPEYDLQIRVRGQQDFIPAGNFGVWTNPGKILGIGDLEFAGSIQLPRTVRAVGTVDIEKIGARFQSEFLDPEVIALTVADDATATAEFRLAPFYRVGAKYGADLGGGIAFDVEGAFVYEAWSVYDHIFLATKGVTVDFTPTDDQPGAELDPVTQPKDWTDSWSARVGTTVALFDRAVELHGGGFYETSAIPNETYSVELVCGDKVGVGIGASGKLWGARLDVAYGHVFVFDRVVGNESIVYNGTAGRSIFLAADTQTRVAMGRYSAGFDMINASLTVGFDELFGFGAHAKKPQG